MATEIKVPTLGESLTEGTVANWLKSEGDDVALDEPILELETDKVTIEVNAPVAGVLGEIIASEGSDVEVGGILGFIENSNSENLIDSTKKSEAVQKDGEVVDVVVPTLGESLTEGTVANWLHSVGDTVALDEPILELETDKVTIEVNAPTGGVIIEIMANAGDEVEVGAILG